jgi:hypothetical protein
MTSLRDHAAAAALAAATALGCASSSPAPATSTPRAEETRPACRGTLGFEAAPLTKKTRARLGLPASVSGVVVVAVLPGGPAEAAGLRADDVVEKIGADAIANDCDWSRRAFGRACEAVTVAVRRGTETLELSLVPADQDRLLERVCKGGDSAACFRVAWLIWSDDRGSGRALELFEEACRAGSAEACAYAGLQLSYSKERGRRRPRSSSGRARGTAARRARTSAFSTRRATASSWRGTTAARRRSTRRAASSAIRRAATTRA